MARISFWIFDGCMSSSVVSLIDAFFIANIWYRNFAGSGGPELFETRIVSTDGAPIRASGNIRMEADMSIRETAPGECVFLASFIPSITPMPQEMDRVCTWLNTLKDRETLIATICTGTFLLAEAGLLDGKKATTNWQYAGMFKKRYPRVRLVPENILTVDGNIICAGAATAVNNLALYLIKAFGSDKLARACAKALLIDPNRQVQTPYTMLMPVRSHEDPEVLKAQDLIESGYNRIKKIDDIARDVGISPRHFKRRFKQATGEQPSKYLQKVRIDAAKQLLENTRESIDKITWAVGYQDTSSFCRLFKHHTDISPAGYRKKFFINYP